MRGVCQTCGATAPLEWFVAEAVGRQTTAVMLELPKDVQGHLLQYLCLFRPATGRGLAPKKALRLVTEIRDLVAKGYVDRQGRPDRNCPPHIWATAMETMINQRDGLSLPMPNHNYVKKIAWDQADSEDRRQESEVRKSEVRGQRLEDEATEPEWVDFTDLTAAELARIPESIRKKHGRE